MARYLLDETGEVLYEFKDNEKIVIYDSLNTKRNIINNKLFYKLYKDSLLIFINEHISQKVFKTLFGLIRLLDFILMNLLVLMDCLPILGNCVSILI